MDRIIKTYAGDIKAFNNTLSGISVRKSSSKSGGLFSIADRVTLSDDSDTNNNFINSGKENRSYLVSDYSFLKKSALSDLREKFQELETDVKSLSDQNNFNNKVSSLSNSDSVEVVTSNETPVGKYTVSVNQVAKGGGSASGEVSDPFSSLGYSGNFKVNGATIQVSTGDSLDDIKNKINYGEDFNSNGELDEAEDRNGNGVIDIYKIKGVYTDSGYINSYYFSEDIDKDGKLRAAEDVNSNSNIDGGTKKTQVAASIERNRLILEHTGGGDIVLEDEDGILGNIKFFENDLKGISVQKETQLTAKGENLIEVPKKSVLEVDGKTYNRTTNEINDIIPSTNINIKKTSSKDVTVSIKSDNTNTINNIEDFIKSYNSALDSIDNENLLNVSVTLETESAKINNELLESVSVPITGLNPADTSDDNDSLNGSLKEYGITSNENNKLEINSKKLSNSINDNSAAAANVFSDLSSNINEQTKNVLDESSGILQIQQDILDYYKENLSKLESDQLDTEKADIDREVSNNKGSLIDVVAG